MSTKFAEFVFLCLIRGASLRHDSAVGSEKRIRHAYPGTEPPPLLVADQEVAEEDGVHRSIGSKQVERDNDDDDDDEDDEDRDRAIVLKSEPVSPEVVDCDDVEIESCQRSELEDALAINQDKDSASATQYPTNSTRQRAKADTYCELCKKSFSRAWSLQRHMADTHFYVPQLLACNLCGRSYKSRNSLISHKSQYHARK